MKIESPPDVRTNLIDRFAWWEKLIWRLLYAQMLIVAVWAIYLDSFVWAMIYLCGVVIGMGAVVLLCLCSHCPYPFDWNTCLFLPHRWVQQLIPFRGGRMTRLDKILFVTAFGMTIAMPQYWLFGHPLLLALFWAAGLPMLIAFRRHYCRRCRHATCPLNRCTKKHDTASALPATGK